MKSLREHLLVPVDDLAGQRAQLVYAPNESLHMLPFVRSSVRLALYCLLSLASCGCCSLCPCGTRKSSRAWLERSCRTRR